MSSARTGVSGRPRATACRERADPAAPRESNAARIPAPPRPESLSCPWCRTRFGIPAALWERDDGRVRCGACAVIFDLHDAALARDLIEAEASVAFDALDGASDVGTDYGFAPDLEDEDEDEDAESASPSRDAELHPIDLGARPGPWADAAAEGFAPGPRSGSAPRWRRRLSVAGSMIVMSLGIAVLSATSMRDAAIVQTHALPRAFAGFGCRLAACSVPLPFLPDELLLSRRQVYSHPERADTLVLEAAFSNGATRRQRMPTLRLRFSDLRGDVVAMHEFVPSRYVGADRAADGVAPGERIGLRVELPDPGERAARFDIAFAAGQDLAGDAER